MWHFLKFFNVLSAFQETKEKEAAELGMKNVGGVFLVLAAGLSIACIIACVERYWVSRRKKVALKLVGTSVREGPLTYGGGVGGFNTVKGEKPSNSKQPSTKPDYCLPGCCLVSLLFRC